MISFEDVRIPAWLLPKLGPADQERVRREALRVLRNEKRDEALGEDWQAKYTCWEFQIAQEIVADFLLELEIKHLEEAEIKAPTTDSSSPATEPTPVTPT